MILQLHIKNIALIEDCTLEFGDKLNVLSGETGAGKSIIIDALGFVLGDRADKGLIRHDASCASVEAVFDLSESPLTKSKMTEMGLEEEDTLILFRSMTESKSEVRINGRLASLSMLKELAATLVDILGQHENQLLLSASTHVELLDKYGEGGISSIKTKYKELFDRYSDVKEKLARFGDAATRARKMDILKYQIDEISAAELQDGEEEMLLADRERFRNAEKILNAVAVSSSALEGDDSFSVQSAVSTAISALRQATQHDESLAELDDRWESAYVEINDICDELHAYTDSFDFDDAKAAYIERRVDLIRSLKRKYGATIKDVLIALETYQKEYNELSDADAEIEAISKQKDELYSLLLSSAEKLSEARRAAGKKLKKELEFELSQLGMPGVLFEVSFSSGEDFLTENGFDRIEFMISPNPGEPLRSLSKIISGGEMSRFMLAMKVITARLDGIQTLVFDEVDAGISGRIGEVVAEKLVMVSSARQVIAITHLPQVAAMSDHHYLIEKSSKNGVTKTQLIKLDESGVVREVERLAAGVGTYGTLHATELRKIALQKKDELRKMQK